MALATQAEHGYDSSYLDQGFKCNFASNISNLSLSKAAQTGRTKTFTRKATFSPVNNFDWNTRYGAMVYAYRNGEDFYPVIDTLFYNHSGRTITDLDFYRDVGVRWIAGNQLQSFDITIGTDEQSLYSGVAFLPSDLGKFVALSGTQGLTTSRTVGFSSAPAYWPSPRISSQQIKILSTENHRYISPYGLFVYDSGLFFNSGNQVIDALRPTYHGDFATGNGNLFPLFHKSSVTVLDPLGSVFYTGWNQNTAVNTHSIISYLGRNYAAIQDSSGINPVTGIDHWMLLNGDAVESQLYGVNTMKFRLATSTGYYVVYDDESGARQLLPFESSYRISLSGCFNGSGIFPVDVFSHGVSSTNIGTNIPYVYNDALIPKDVGRVYAPRHFTSLSGRGSGRGWKNNQFTEFYYSGYASGYNPIYSSGSIPIYVALAEIDARTYGYAFPWTSKVSYSYIPSGQVHWTNFLPLF